MPEIITKEGDGTLDHNALLWVCVECNSQDRISIQPWTSQEKFAVFIRTQLEMGFVYRRGEVPKREVRASHRSSDLFQTLTYAGNQRSLESLGPYTNVVLTYDA
ncbi:hypothetical protein TNCV_5117471 [Trichonephila clavipes]|nr:hypothetical protein TNCV_5117471 [Trichonephila clavipes]